MHIGAPWRGLNVLPPVISNQSERQAALYFYSGILASAPSSNPSTQYLFSAMNIGCPWRGINAETLGTITQGERQAVYHYCAHILATTAPNVVRGRRGIGRLIYSSVGESVLSGIGG